MEGSKAWDAIFEDVWLKQFPLNVFGCALGRTVLIFRLKDGQILVYSNAFFEACDVDFIRSLGGAVHILENTCFHDTCTRIVLEQFPEASYYVPENFPIKNERFKSVTELQTILQDELHLITLGGMPKVNEVALFDPQNNLLGLADLLFNFSSKKSWWTRFFLRNVSGIREFPGMSRLFKTMIKDQKAFSDSMDQLRTLDFQHLIVSHNDPVFENGKKVFEQALERNGF